MKSARLFVVNSVFSIIPPTKCFAFKRSLLRWAGAKIGSNVRIVSSARFYLSGNLEIGSDTWIGHEVLVAGGNANVTIGKKVDVAPRVSMVTGSHKLWQAEEKAAGEGYSLPIRIEDGAWLGAATTVLGGVSIGRCSVVAAGSVVNNDVAPFCLFGGTPARFICRK